MTMIYQLQLWFETSCRFFADSDNKDDAKILSREYDKTDFVGIDTCEDVFSTRRIDTYTFVGANSLFDALDTVCEDVQSDSDKYDCLKRVELEIMNDRHETVISRTFFKDVLATLNA